MLDRLVTGLAATAPIQETLHVTKYPASIWFLVLMDAFLLLPVVLVSVAMLFLHRAQQTRRSLRLFVLAIAWSIAALTTACFPLADLLLPNLNIKMLLWAPISLTIAYQLLFIAFAVDLVAFCRSSFYRIQE
jgi:hypothetical protein